MNPSRGPPAKAQHREHKAEPQLWGTALGSKPGLCTWLLGAGKQFILLTQIEWKEVAQSWDSAGRALVPHSPPPQREGPTRALGDSLELLVCSSVCLWGHRSQCLGSGGYWSLRSPSRCSPLLTAAYAPPSGAAGRGHQCARS